MPAPMSSTPTPIMFHADMEIPQPDEQATDVGINETMAKIRETTFQHSGTAIRSVHAKSHGVLTGKLSVAAGLPEVLAQGLFAAPGTYPVAIRFSSTPGDIVDDSVSTPRAMSVKVVGVSGTRVAGGEDEVTQDFVLINGPAFVSPNAAAFLKNLKLLAATTDRFEAGKKIASAIFRGTEAVIEAFGGKNATIIAIGGQQETHILGETFYSQVPILFGKYIAKIAVFPVAPELTALTNAPLDVNGKPNGLRDAVIEYFLKHGGSWELRAQLCTDLKTMPIEDASVAWPEDASPYLTVATIDVPPQHAWTDAKIAAIDAGLSFSPWHALADHRPLGSVMRARKTSYQQSAKFRAERNGVPVKEPRTAADLPGV